MITREDNPLEEKEIFHCSECGKLLVRGYLLDANDDMAHFCSSCTMFFCSGCGFFDEHDDHFMCNTCWLNKTRGLISNEKYIEAAWIFKHLGKSREFDEMKELEIERRKRLNMKMEVLKLKKEGYIEKD
jgi:hypothetical protein